MARKKAEKPAEAVKTALDRKESIMATLADAIFFAAIDTAQGKVSGTVTKRDGQTFKYEADLKEVN
jgi:hypothetical protein